MRFRANVASVSPVVAGGADPGLPAHGSACFAGLAAPGCSRGAIAAVLLAAGGCVGTGGAPDERAAGWIYSSATGVDPSELVASRNGPAAEGPLQTLELRRRATDGRRFYVCRAWLDVCGSAEAVCKPHRFDAFFHEDGAFIGYRVAPDHPFTKAEHDPFRQRDYAHLDGILRNPGHALADLPPPRRATRTGANGVAGIDGVTGATIAHYSGQAVPHAFYTSHAVWHLVNRTLPPALRDWTLQWAGPADVRAWVAAGATLKAWWFLDRMEAGAIAPRAAADLAYELLATTNGHVQAAALRYIRRTATPFRPESCRARDYAAIPDATKPAFLEWWAGEGFTEPALDRALQADLVARAPTRSPVALAILGYLQQIGPRPAAADAWRGALEAFARATPSTYLRAKAQSLMAGAGPKDSHGDAEDAERKRKGAEKRRDRITGWTG